MNKPHPQGIVAYLKVTIPPCSGSQMHCSSDEFLKRLRRALQGKPAYYSAGVPMEFSPGQLVLNRLKLHCPRCSANVRVEIATDSETIRDPQPQGQALLFGIADD